MSPDLVKKRLRKGEEVLRAQRPVTLIWGRGEPKLRAEGREGFATEAADFEGTGMVRRMACTFYVLRELIAEKPKIDTVFSLDGRADRWRLQRIKSGQSPNDLLWVLECVEEHS